MATKRNLPAKEAAAFKNLLHLYETRAYKQALKVADQILKKAPDHGETTSMKGLVLTNLQKKEEGIQLVKKGVLLDVTSHICWHVLGIVHKADRNYDEALKCYLRALKFDKDNVNILRDAAQLQLQLRQYEPLQDTRLALLRLRPNARIGWIGLAVAYRLNNRPQDARKVLEQYLTVLKGIPDYDVEYSELLLYYIGLIEETGDYAEALQILDSNAKSRAIVDRTAILTSRARLLQKQGHKEQAGEVWHRLLEQNPESHEYYKHYLSSHDVDIDNLTDEGRSKSLELLQTLATDLARSNAPKRLILTISSGDVFRSAAEAYLSDGLTRGIPSLFADIKSLYSDHAKWLVVGELVEAFAKNALDSAPNPENEDPTPYVWATYFLAQHHSFMSPAEPTKALEYINTAISHTPTLPELYMVKARIQKRAGDSIRAARTMDEARQMDLQDRFLNTKNAKYLLRDGQVDAANALLGLFTKKDAQTPGADLEEMQSLLYLSEEGASYHHSGKLSMALKRYHGIEKTFVDFEDDQYDFHSYCIRRHTLNSYESLLRFEDSLRSHPAYVAAALGATKIYLQLHDDSAGTIASSVAALGDSQKRPKKKAKKSDKKATAPVSIPADDALPPPPKDEDPDGMKLLRVKDPLEPAIKLLKPLEELCSQDINVWLAIYDIAIRRKKYLQAVRALAMAHQLESDNPELHHRLIDFKVAVSDASGIPEHVQPVVSAVLAELIPNDSSAEAFNTAYLQRHPASSTALLAYSRSVLRIRGPGAAPEAEETLFQLANPETVPSIQTGVDAIDLLLKVKSGRTDEFRSAMSSRFPFSTAFKSEPERTALRSEPSIAADADDPEGPI